MAENGIIDRLQAKWIGQQTNRRRTSLDSLVVVGAGMTQQNRCLQGQNVNCIITHNHLSGQIVLIFFVMVGTIVAVLLVVALEMMWSDFKTNGSGLW